MHIQFHQYEVRMGRRIGTIRQETKQTSSETADVLRIIAGESGSGIVGLHLEKNSGT